MYSNRINQLTSSSSSSSSSSLLCKLSLLMFLLLLLCITGYLCQSSDADVNVDLYATDPNVQSLNDVNFNAYTLQQPHLVGIIFYVHWCGHCIQFSYTAKHLAEELRPWRKAIRLVAVNCEIYSSICINLNISAYPTVIILPAMSANFYKGTQLDTQELEIKRLNATIRHFVINDPFVARTFRLIPVHVARKEEICNILMATANQTATLANQQPVVQYAIVEHRPTPSTAEVILDLANYDQHLRITRFYGGHSLLDSFYRMHTQLPVVVEVVEKYYGNNCNLRIQINADTSTELRKKLVNFITEKYKLSTNHHQQSSSFNNNNSTIVKSSPPSSSSSSSRATTSVIRYKLGYTDLYNTLRHMLVKEIPRWDTLNATQVGVIKQLFSTIYKYFPFRNENVRRFFKRTNHWLVNKNASIKAASYKEALKIGGDGFLKPMESWRHCNGSKPIYRGYPCGLWVLFHTLTVNEYTVATRKNVPVMHEVMQTMRKYVQTFFSCEECAVHFGDAATNMNDELIYANSSILFLWRIHNQVNHRLQGEPDEDPYYPKQQFPTKQQCGECYGDDNDNDDDNNNDNGGSGGSHHGHGGGHYQMEQVLQFLTNYYSKNTLKNNAAINRQEKYLTNFSIIFAAFAASSLISTMLIR